ncbi:type II CAAX prenyl endopeptidase Rce1 family protein [Paenibacillus aurantiacus]|uniref:Type II CAAX prenyl endopeptidase Rce1 family protein n=1 Tax=Paenibacillus aurantiacus TaxID=1936118 RepID=A0ABV5KLW1_9BACL
MTTQPTAKRSLSASRPVLSVIIIELLLLIAMTAAGAYATIKELSYTSPVLIAFIPIALALIIYMSLRRKWGQYGFRSLRGLASGGWRYYAPLALVCAVLCFKGFEALTVTKVAFFLFFTLLVAFVEETIYRGLILNILLPKGAMTAVVVSSVLFSVTHMLNMLSGQSLGQTILQLAYSLLVGLALALLMVKDRLIWPLILFHFVHNLVQFLGKEGEFVVLDSLVLAILAVHCAWIMAGMAKGRRRIAAGAKSAHLT